MLMTPVPETNKHVHSWWIQRRTSLVDDVSDEPLIVKNKIKR